MTENEKFIIELKKQVEASEIELVDINTEIQKAMAIGMDVSGLQDKYKSLKDQIELTKTVYKL